MGLNEIAPGVMVGPGYKKGKNKALDNVIDQLKINPKSLDKSGFGNKMLVKKKKKSKTRRA